MNYKVRFFKSKKDLIVKLTDDNIINITGMIGSGKTTLADKYRNDKNYIVISLDCLYRGQDKENMNDTTMKINCILKEKYPDKDNEKYFKQYYTEILRYIDNNKTTNYCLEGQHIYRYLKPEDIRGVLIIKRTRIISCCIRSITRHIKRKKLELKEGKITRKQYNDSIRYWTKRRISQIRHYKELNLFIDELNNYNKI